ncbi:MAG: hypothetical protein LIP00_13125 [Parabacteroides sp.]|nr:hypothetical protein [Parabacteroides sp.]
MVSRVEPVHQENWRVFRCYRLLFSFADALGKINDAQGKLAKSVGKRI